MSEPLKPMSARSATSILIRTREKSACVTCLSRAVVACRQVARQKRAAAQHAREATALECVEAVRALITEVV